MSNYLSMAGSGRWKNHFFDFSNGYLIDHTVLDFIHEFSKNYSLNGGSCRQTGHPLETSSDHDLAARLMIADDRKN